MEGLMVIWRSAFLIWAGFLLLTLVACSPAARQRAGSVARGGVPFESALANDF